MASAGTRFAPRRLLTTTSTSPTYKYRAYIAFGSNIGFGPTIADDIAQRWKTPSRELRLSECSALYATRPTAHGVIRPAASLSEKENKFYTNAVFRIDTNYSPADLLAHCKRLEAEFGRSANAARHAGRPLDLDIVAMFDGRTGEMMRVDTGESGASAEDASKALCIPHRSLHDRDFVLVPLADVLQVPDGKQLKNPRHQTIWGQEISLEAFEKRTILHLITRFGKSLCSINADGEYEPRLVGILNASPDSFSYTNRGGEMGDAARRIDLLRDLVEGLVRDGAEAIDIGGESTRPGATPVDAETELSRVLPIIEHIKRTFPDIPMSIDTSKASVAEEALRAGACVVNDVTAGEGDMRMYSVIAAHNAGFVAMHGGDDPTTMTDLSMFGERLSECVAMDLRWSLLEAMSAGIPRWRIHLDPGLGFEKTHVQSSDLLSQAAQLCNYAGGGWGTWIGASRKRFVRGETPPQAGEPSSKAFDIAAADRATAASTAIACANGADFIRVHDPKSSLEALRVGRDVRRARIRRAQLDVDSSNYWNPT